MIKFKKFAEDPEHRITEVKGYDLGFLVRGEFVPKDEANPSPYDTPIIKLSIEFTDVIGTHRGHMHITAYYDDNEEKWGYHPIGSALDTVSFGINDQKAIKATIPHVIKKIGS